MFYWYHWDVFPVLPLIYAFWASYEVAAMATVGMNPCWTMVADLGDYFMMYQQIQLKETAYKIGYKNLIIAALSAATGGELFPRKLGSSEYGGINGKAVSLYTLYGAEAVNDFTAGGSAAVNFEKCFNTENPTYFKTLGDSYLWNMVTKQEFGSAKFSADDGLDWYYLMNAIVRTGWTIPAIVMMPAYAVTGGMRLLQTWFVFYT